ncbi:ribose 5-phosphate isomerase B [Paraliomyxa miuraensis]|uniref:ribose 5-phosphate isomerase B n=1 Tax=Paraliomyxa miuraensis TaxID=376150 RepID=UPI00225745CD|nr:ribose 5-phosphate isomerase B [Paraliomyxa miuraensis]MCX4244657.1 ribose 5-phosphate isomerase B [Paraliomyxa miuraensis]
MRWYVGGDHGAVALRKHLVERLRAGGHEVVLEVGPDDPSDSIDYPDIAVEVCRTLLAEGDPASRGLLVCGTGQGIAMAANRIPGIRAAVVTEPLSARMARTHNDANVLCMGGRVLGLGLAEELLRAFVEAEFEGGRHARRVGKIEAISSPAAATSAKDSPSEHGES